MLVEARVVGRSGAVIEPRSVDFVSASPLLHDLIAHVVRDEVRQYQQRRRRGRLVRVLTPDEVSHGAVAGKIDPGGRETAGPADADAAVATALQAFDDGLYFVFVDDIRIEDLATPLVIRDDTRVRFVRLVALAGGC